MAIITEELLKKQINSGKTVPLYILFGDDGFLKKTYAEKIINKVTDKDDIFNYTRFEADCELQDVYDAVSQLPVMSDKKCVVLCDYDFEHCSKSDFDKLCLLASETYDTSVLILWFDSFLFDAKKSAKFKKLSAAAEKGGGVVCDLNHRRVPELVKMLTDAASKRGCRLDSSSAKYLVETAGEDIGTLKNEIDKLCYYMPEGNITKKDIDYICVKTAEASIYNLSKQIFSCNAEGALKTLDELFFARTEPMIILYTVSSVYIDAYRVYVCKKNGKTIKQTAEIFGYKNREFVLERAAQNLSKLNYKKMSISFDALIDADRKLKSFGTDARTVLEQLIIRLIYIVAKGEAVDKA